MRVWTLVGKPQKPQPTTTNAGAFSEEEVLFARCFPREDGGVVSRKKNIVLTSSQRRAIGEKMKVLFKNS